MTRGADAHFDSPAMRTVLPAYRQVRQSLQDLPPARPWHTGHSGRDRSNPPRRRLGTGSGQGWLAHPRPRALGVATAPSIPGGKARSAPLRGGGPLVRRPAGRRAARRHRERPGRAGDLLAVAFPHGIAGREGPRSGGEDGAVRLHPPRCRSRHGREGGPSHPRPRSADRHRRSAGRGTTKS